MANASTEYPAGADVSRISVTAKLVAYGRSFSDVPFAKEVARMVDAAAIYQRMFTDVGIPPAALDWLPPMVEARYKSLVSAIRRSGVHQVLELASGVSLRGLAMSQDPALTYVETDLSGITEEKRRIAASLRATHHLADHGNLYFDVVNVLVWPEVEAAVAHFDPAAPVAVVHEGLLQYLSFEEKATAARHIRRVLERFGGVWLTPDLENRALAAARATEAGGAADKMVHAIQDATHRDMAAAAFEDEAHVQRFFRDLGFTVTARDQLDGSFSLTCPQRASLDPGHLPAAAGSMRLWELRLASPGA